MTELNRLIIKRPGSLLSIITDRELTEEQTKLVEAFITMIEEFTPQEMTEFSALMEPLIKPLAPLGGIEQYQAESR